MTTLEATKTNQNQDINSANQDNLKPEYSRPSPMSPILSGLNDALGIMAASVNAELSQIVQQLADRSSGHSEDKKIIHDSLLSAKIGLKEIISMIGVFDEALAMISKRFPQAPYEQSLFDNAFNMVSMANGTLGILCCLFSDSNSDQVDDNDLYYTIDSVIKNIANIAIDIGNFHNTSENQQA